MGCSLKSCIESEDVAKFIKRGVAAECIEGGIVTAFIECEIAAEFIGCGILTAFIDGSLVNLVEVEVCSVEFGIMGDLSSSSSDPLKNDKIIFLKNISHKRNKLVLICKSLYHS